MYEIELLANFHKRKHFTCGIEPIDSYLKQQAGKEIKAHVATTFILRAKEDYKVMGCYTLSSIAVDVGELPEYVSEKFTQNSLLPATLLSRLAIHTSHQGNNLRELLIVDALWRSIQASQEVASFAVVVEPTDEMATNFYRYYGFTQFFHHKCKLFLPMATAVKLFLN